MPVLIQPAPTARAAEAARPLPAVLWAFWAGSVVTFCLMFVVGFLRWRLGQPRTWYNPLGGPLFGDLLEYRPVFRLMHTAAFFHPAVSPFAYPPFAAVFYRGLFATGHPVMTYLLLTALWLAVLTTGTARWLRTQGLARSTAWLLPVTVLLMAFPVEALVRYGNVELFLWMFAAGGTWAFCRDRPKMAAVLWGCAGAMKLYPLALLVLLLPTRQWRALAAGVASFAVVTPLSLWYVGPTVSIAWNGSLQNVFGYQQFRLEEWTLHELATNHSAFLLVKVPLRVLGYPAHPALAPYYVCGCLLFAAAFFLRLRRLPVVNQLLATTVFMVLLPSVSYFHTLVHLLAPLLLLAGVAIHANRQGIAIPGLAGTLALYVPLFGCFMLYTEPHCGLYGGLVQAALLLMLFIRAVRYPFAPSPLQAVHPVAATPAGARVHRPSTKSASKAGKIFAIAASFFTGRVPSLRLSNVVPTSLQERAMSPRFASLLFCALACPAGALLLNGCGGGSSASTPTTTTTGTGSGSGGGSTVVVKASVPTAARLLDQTGFGPTQTDIAHVQSVGVNAYLAEQFAAPPTTLADIPSPYPTQCMNAPAPCLESEVWQTMLTAPDQLRQRVTFSLTELFVVSTQSVNAQSMPPYWNVLAKDTFTNWRTLMEDMTLSPAMGLYLNMIQSNKPASGQIANENFGREMLQLFSIGLVQLNQDGTPQLDGSGNPIPAYTEAQVEAFARAYTGWTYAVKGGASPAKFPNTTADYDDPMAPVDANHDTASKTLLNGTVLSAGGTARADLKGALDNIFASPNLPPFVSKQLIQHLVTSTPSPAYVARVAAVFTNNGSGVRGDMEAVLTAILTDAEARAGDTNAAFDGGHLREPMLYLTSAMRGLGYTSTNTDATNLYPYLSLSSYTSGLGEAPFRSPSVFNFYPPEYVIPGTTLNAPEFGLENTATVNLRLTLANNLSTGKLSGFSTDLSATSTLGQLAATPGDLADALGVLFLHGQMPANMRAQIVSTVTGITDLPTRVRVATYLVLSSSQYKVMH